MILNFCFLNNLLQIGKIAPNFLTIEIYKNKLGKIRFLDYHGKKYVLLLFYPANFTSFFSTELIKLSDRIHEFRQLSTQILAISMDSPFYHLHYLLVKRNQGGLSELEYSLVSDSNLTITKKYKLLTKDGLSFPRVFIIDKDGIIQYYTLNNLFCGRNIDELLLTLKSIQYIKENPGCPVDWKNSEQILYYHPLKSKVYFQRLYSHKYE